MLSDPKDLDWTEFSEHYINKYEPFVSDKLELKYHPGMDIIFRFHL